MKCSSCENLAVARIPTLDEHVCVACAEKFWKQIVTVGSNEERLAEEASAVDATEALRSGYSSTESRRRSKLAI